MFVQALLGAINRQQDAIRAWFDRAEATKDLPLYSSVDLRDAGFKLAVVDCNLFPSGFNNLCEHGMADASQAMRAAILERVPGCRNVLVIAEEHTRNTWYLEHLRVLQDILEQAGFEVRIATFLTVQPAVCQDAKSVELETATGRALTVYCLQRLVKEMRAGSEPPCFVMLNHDLIAGVPEVLREIPAPMYPSMKAGWHSRLKSQHFQHTGALVQEFAAMLGLDPWLLSCLHAVVDGVTIHAAEDRQRLADAAAQLMTRIRAKYSEHHIAQPPFVFLKPDSGTYGMGVMAFEDPGELLELSRRDRNQLYKGKGGTVIRRYLLQEGVPSAQRVDDHVGEMCIYQAANRLIGGFYRTHRTRTERENLNAPGMGFKTMCPHSARYGDAEVQAETIFDAYRLLARIAGIAAMREIHELEAAVGP